ncbi:MAG TPA: ABC transporter permease [Acidisoma sp.]|jgi:peptide/nickel transport system permease protein|uniref:ABC transporter permease n=1 Tax=Acidisoma sp. TaxID=1872115 RepID=UPI002CDACBBC|nr:ABC transporter permease [Acidisoma sp.]HTH99444.1 ABC transporter permease [Acidisoma sp.]
MRYILRRLGFFLVTLWAAMTVNFFLPRLMPGNPAMAMMARFHGRLNGDSLHAMEVAFGVNSGESLIAQYFSYLGNSFTGQFGRSLTFFPQTVSHVVFSALPWTLGLVGVTTIIAFILGTLIGMVGGWRRGGLFDSILPPLFIILSAFPYFWIGLLSILIFSISLGWLPTGFGYTNGTVASLSWGFAWDVIRHAVLPAATIVVTSIGGWILTMRNNMIMTLNEDYVRMARAKGVSSARIMFDYAGRNAILPNLSGFGMSLGLVVSGAILVEYVFSYPGVGYMMLQAVLNEDFPLMQALFLFLTLAVLLAILVVDGVTVLLDPRTRGRT